MSHIKIAIIDDSKEFRDALRYFIEQISDFIVVGEAENGFDFIKLAETQKIDIALVDVRMPVMDGITATSQILRSYHPYMRVIAISIYNDLESVKAMIEAGALGYIQKERLFENIEIAIKMVMKNKYFFLNSNY